MPGTYLNYPFDEELFLQSWAEEPDPVKTALLESGAMVADNTIGGMIQSNGNIYTIPFYNVLEGDPVNYDGQTDITSTETAAASQTGVVYGRAKGFTARDFVSELSGSDPMGHIVRSVARYWAKYRQKTLLNILTGVFGITGNAAWQKHSVDTGGSPMEATTLGDAATDVLGDNKDKFCLAVMHSHVAHQLEKLEMLQFWKYTDPNGVERPMNIAAVNGYTAIVDDGVPVSGENESAKYTTYLLGEGVLRYAVGWVDHPVEVHRDPAKSGGQDTLYTRIRETIHPNGFSFKVPSSDWKQSPTDAQLAASANWVQAYKDAKAIPMARITTTG